jgi:hypothetical protein
MWAQLIKLRLQPGSDITGMVDVLKRFEQPDSGLVRELVMHDTKDADIAYVLAVFESEEKAREREQDPRRAEGQAALQELMTKALAGAPEFTNLTVVAEWAP